MTRFWNSRDHFLKWESDQWALYRFSRRPCLHMKTESNWGKPHLCLYAQTQACMCSYTKVLKTSIFNTTPSLCPSIHPLTCPLTTFPSSHLFIPLPSQPLTHSLIYPPIHPPSLTHPSIHTPLLQLKFQGFICSHHSDDHWRFGHGVDWCFFLPVCSVTVSVFFFF